jgi:hypothetical protein
LFLFNFLFVHEAIAAVVNASDCSRTHVEAAINSASTGDTVIIPSGTSQWDSPIPVQKEISIQGAGVDSTIIERQGFTVDSIDNWRITGMTFNGEAQAIRPMTIKNSKNWRIDHIKFYDYNCNIAGIQKYSYGLIDHCDFLDVAGEIINITSYDGYDAWDRDTSLGLFDNGTIYIEDCTFTQETRKAMNPVDSNNGARWVFRYNTVTSKIDGGYGWALENHGYCSQQRGTVSTEIYGNTFVESGPGTMLPIQLRGGSGVVFNNAFVGTFNNVLLLKNYRSLSDCYSGGQCSARTGCAGTLADCDSAYPALDQINNLYVWGNTLSGTAFNTVSVPADGCNAVHIQENRDYFVFEMPGYTPYPYPHPLAQDEGIELPGVPPNLQIQ